MATVDTLHSHQYQHFEDLQLSAKEIYTMLEDMVKEYQYPDVTFSRVNMKEGNILSASREYLVISRKRHNFYVCAAPFGKSFFISWYHMEDANTTANITAKIPLVGQSMAKGMESKTYFQLDSELMFTNSINMIIKMAIEKVKATHGFTRENAQ
ncbi:hypothetical protein [Mucilaginibacter ginsenosidivorans]|uniref:Uncharacterized protein n=1 Tax=Mucilaginibacter ginsenosidivorans TaxID=398053 RepID=A0A5B8US17_9SPHI|nr:hypothetical protein [Mucilaginibacter ginsenosidivorans]QEC61749.1 hypothetical protein FRZ54_03830 [Mucilaginibacter ginsenosidivorans]